MDHLPEPHRAPGGSPGCFRCRDNKHKTDDGEKIGKKCNTCHNVVADEESDSALLQEMGIQEPPPAPAEPTESAGPAGPVATSASR